LRVILLNIGTSAFKPVATDIETLNDQFSFPVNLILIDNCFQFRRLSCNRIYWRRCTTRWRRPRRWRKIGIRRCTWRRRRTVLSVVRAIRLTADRYLLSAVSCIRWNAGRRRQIELSVAIRLTGNWNWYLLSAVSCIRWTAGR